MSKKAKQARVRTYTIEERGGRPEMRPEQIEVAGEAVAKLLMPPSGSKTVAASGRGGGKAS